MKDRLTPFYDLVEVRRDDLPKVFVPAPIVTKFDPNVGTPESFYKYERFGEHRPVS